LVEGLFFATLFVVILYLVQHVPPLISILALLVLPTIPAVYSLRQRFGVAVGFALCTISLLALFSETLMLMAIWLYFAGLGLGWGFRWQMVTGLRNNPTYDDLLHKALEVVLPGFAGAMVGTATLVGLVPTLTGSPLASTLASSLEQTFSYIASFSQEGAQAAEAVRRLALLKEEIMANTLFYFCVGAMLVTFCSFMATRFLLLHSGMPLPFLPRYNLWTLPQRTMMVLMTTFLPLLFASENGGWHLFLLDSINQFILLLCILLGVAVQDFYLQRWRCPKWLRLVLRLLVMLMASLQTVALLLGMLDVGFDLRRLKRNTE